MAIASASSICPAASLLGRIRTVSRGRLVAVAPLRVGVCSYPGDEERRSIVSPH